MTKSTTRTIETGVGALRVTIETTGYVGGDSSITTFSIRPTGGYQHHAEIFSLDRMYSYDDHRADTDSTASISFQARGDIELDGLRQALREASDVLDELLK